MKKNTFILSFKALLAQFLKETICQRGKNNLLFITYYLLFITYYIVKPSVDLWKFDWWQLEPKLVHPLWRNKIIIHSTLLDIINSFLQL